MEFRQIGRAVCGLANTEGGVVVLGVDDEGAIVGVAGEVQSVEERLTNHLQNGCSAPVRGSIGRHLIGSAHVHWVEVPRQRLAAEGHPATTIGGHSGSHRERRGSPRLCNHRIQGALRGFLR
ncbi:MAG: ATP-binding protein, partial [Gammaproteobacteria bacterium]|nr:ATP-binding protein [Gammaproteobacteria bacterium]